MTLNIEEEKLKNFKKKLLNDKVQGSRLEKEEILYNIQKLSEFR